MPIKEALPPQTDRVHPGEEALKSPDPVDTEDESHVIRGYD